MYTPRFSRRPPRISLRFVGFRDSDICRAYGIPEDDEDSGADSGGFSEEECTEYAAALDRNEDVVATRLPRKARMFAESEAEVRKRVWECDVWNYERGCHETVQIYMTSDHGQHVVIIGPLSIFFVGNTDKTGLELFFEIMSDMLAPIRENWDDSVSHVREIHIWT